jgi:hypothetical protein
MILVIEDFYTNGFSSTSEANWASIEIVVCMFLKSIISQENIFGWFCMIKCGLVMPFDTFAIMCTEVDGNSMGCKMMTANQFKYHQKFHFM